MIPACRAGCSGSNPDRGVRQGEGGRIDPHPFRYVPSFGCVPRMPGLEIWALSPFRVLSNVSPLLFGLRSDALVPHPRPPERAGTFRFMGLVRRFLLSGAIGLSVVWIVRVTAKNEQGLQWLKANEFPLREWFRKHHSLEQTDRDEGEHPH